MKEKIVRWIKDYFDKNGETSMAVIGISGGTDSSVAAALCVEALGKDRVFGVLMPQDNQHDIDKSYELVNFLGIKSITINIGKIYNQMTTSISSQLGQEVHDCYVYRSNTPARIRMSILYGVSATCNGRVVNTCNLSEDYIGYSTKFGDSAGDFSPLAQLTKTEVKEVGYQLGLPKDLIEKAPEDGLSGKTDEDNFGFTYAVLDRYLRTGQIEDEAIRNKIDTMHKRSLHKLLPMPSYNPMKPHIN